MYVFTIISVPLSSLLLSMKQETSELFEKIDPCYVIVQLCHSTHPFSSSLLFLIFAFVSQSHNYFTNNPNSEHNPPTSLLEFNKSTPKQLPK